MSHAIQSWTEALRVYAENHLNGLVLFSIAYTVLSMICGLILRARDDRFQEHVRLRYDAVAFLAGADSIFDGPFEDLFASLLFGSPATLLLPIWFLQGEPDNWIALIAGLIIVWSAVMAFVPLVLCPLFMWAQPFVLLFLVIAESIYNLRDHRPTGG